MTAAGRARRRASWSTSAAGADACRADPERLHQVFANLLDNAARHSPPGGTVTVGAHGAATSG